MKQLIKHIFLQKLHAVESQKFDLSNAIAMKGAKEFAELNFFRLREELQTYMNDVEAELHVFKYSASREKPCLYASIYAVMLEGILGVLNNRTKEDLQAWGDYLNSYQREKDGLYYDPNLEGPAFEHIGTWNEGWGKHHLMGHMIIALARLGVKPKYPLTYLEPYYNTEYLTKWMDSFNFAEDVWTVSNYFMNLYTVMEYARDYMNEPRANVAIDTMAKWLLERQNSTTGMWHNKDIEGLSHYEKLCIVRAAYHFYPLFEYEGINVPYKKEIVEFILPLQNSWGGWTVENGNSGACEDIDAIDPLLRYADAVPEKKKEIDAAIKRSMIWQLSSRNADKGFSFYVRAKQAYGGHPLTTSLRDESSMFATWFRTLCLAYEMRHLGIENEFDIGRYPGYEIK